jgi:hypothetical protein
MFSGESMFWSFSAAFIIHKNNIQKRKGSDETLSDAYRGVVYRRFTRDLIAYLVRGHV